MKNKKYNYNLTIGMIITVIVVLMAVIGFFLDAIWSNRYGLYVKECSAIITSSVWMR